MIIVKSVSHKNNLQQVVDEINQSAWDDDNDLTAYDVDSLRAYLGHQDSIFLVCYEETGNQTTFLGMASARIQIKPYAQQRWLYVDELDVCANQRKKGAGKALMLQLLKIARASDCQELWLGTELDNLAANALYRSLHPEEIEQFIGYTYETSD